MKIKVDVTELTLEGHHAIIDLSDSDDKKRYARFFDLYGNLLPDADHCDLLSALMCLDGPDRLNHAGWTEVQDRYIDGCSVVRETEAA